MSIHKLKYALFLQVGKLGDTALKHRSAILLLSVLMLFIDPNVNLILGKASLAGLGITIEPAQTIHVGLFLFVLLNYRVTAFYISIRIESGSDPVMAEELARMDYDPDFMARRQMKPITTEQLVNQEADRAVLAWNMGRVLWEFLFPTVLASVALVTYAIKYIGLYLLN